MSHSQQYGEFIFHCDECDDFIETSTKSFGEAQSIAKQAGWTNVKNPDKSWGNLCPCCIDELLE